VAIGIDTIFLCRLTKKDNTYICMDNSTNLLGHYIFKRIQKDNKSQYNRMNRPREMLTGLYIDHSDIQRYVDDYFKYGIDYMGDEGCADDMYNVSVIPFPSNPSDRIDKYWDDADGKEE